ncbi:MAG: phage Gp37/Gp68 family protein [Oscillospiraceae bacterium]|jgi:protein gp37|nr:phage Gp37/Gp68 family protein [Oscillospiraceae bacterium]
MNKTKIETFDASWNPVTGCRHDCEYCYARSMARRFGGSCLSQKATYFENTASDPRGRILRETRFTKEQADKVFLKKELDVPLGNPQNGKIDPYPFGFEPTLHRYRLDEPQKWKEPRTIFVGSMCDLFGSWVPTSWIKDVFDACAAAPQHRYLFLTKNPGRYQDLDEMALLPRYENFWYGASITDKVSAQRASDAIGSLTPSVNAFASIEPLHESITDNYERTYFDWLIIGAETGNRKDKIIPQRGWVEDIVDAARWELVPIFMKSSLGVIWGEPLIQEFPWEVEK